MKLKLTNLLYGRDKEVGLLEEAFNGIKGHDALARVVFVHGTSGCGKSAVVQSLRRKVRGKEDGNENKSYYVSGKFDQQVNAKPFSALVDALTELCDILIRAPDRQDYKKRILEAVRDEWKTLASAIPNLAKLLGKEEEAPRRDSSRRDSTREQQHGHALVRLKVLFRALLSSFCTHQHPIVMFLDDLQFSDAASLDLIDSLLFDKELHNILFVSAYRDDETTPALEKLLDRTTKSDSFMSITLGGLSLESISDLLAHVTESKRQETLPLAQVILRKTRGNIFFVLQFLKVAQGKGLLYFSMQTLRWTWDVQKIESNMNVSSNVVEFVVDRLHDFPSDVQVLLNIASCIGAQFDEKVLATLYEHKDEEPESGGLRTLYERKDEEPEAGGPRMKLPMELATESSVEKVREMLQLVQEQELVMAGDKRQYMFCHDRIQQASYLLLLEGRDKRLMELRVGLQLLRLYHSPISQRWMRFAAVNSLNRSLELISADEKNDLVKLNLETAKRARQESAFLLAADYLRTATDLLDERTKWTDDYELTLEIYTLSAEMEYTGGNCKKAEAMALELIESGYLREDDKIPLYYTLMRSAGDQLNIPLALDTGIHACSCLGVTIPKNPTLIQVQWHLSKTEKLLKGKTDEQLLSLPKMMNKKKMLAMDFLRTMLIYIWVSGNSNLLSIDFMKEMRLSLKYGKCGSTPEAFASYGMLLASLGKPGEAFRFGELAVQMLEQDKERGIRSKAFVLSIVNAYTSHWRKPLFDSLDPLLDGHRVGMVQSGDVEWACLSAVVYCDLYVHCGLPLEPFTSDTRKFIQVIRDFDQDISLIYAIVPMQFALNLLGRSEDPLILTGEAMDEETTLRDLKATDQGTGLFFTTLLLLELNYIMCEVDVACKHARTLWSFRANTYKGHFIWNEALFFSGLAEFGFARKHAGKKLPRHAMKFLKVIKTYEMEGGVNQHPMRLLLDAEAATFVCSKDRNEVQKTYNKAISAALRSGFTNFAAIANERAAEYMLGADNLFWGQRYMEDARDCYLRWGAEAKAAQLEERYKFLRGSSLKSSSGSQQLNLRGAERYSIVQVQMRGVSEMQRESLHHQESSGD